MVQWWGYHEVVVTLKPYLMQKNMDMHLTHPWDLARFCVDPRDRAVTG